MLSILSSKYICYEGADIAASIGGRIIGAKANRGVMSGIKKIDNMIGRMGGNQQNQQMPPPVPSQPVQQPQPQQPRQ